MARAAKVKAYRRGLLAETLVALLMRLKGYRILARRYRTPAGEIDLIALRGRRLVFLEVKRRQRLQDAVWTVPTRQRRRILRAAQDWLARHGECHGYDMSFDVVLVAPYRWPAFIENAFSA